MSQNFLGLRKPWNSFDRAVVIVLAAFASWLLLLGVIGLLVAWWRS